MSANTRYLGSIYQHQYTRHNQSMKARIKNKKRLEPEEIVRSFAFTVSHQFHGGNQYESVSFFASQKGYAYPGDDAEKVARGVRQTCKKDVIAAAREHIADLRNGEWERGIDPHPVAQANARAYEARQARQMPRRQTADNIGELAEEAITREG